MKYTTPDYEVEAVETKDIITESREVKDSGGNTLGYIVEDPESNSSNVVIPDVGKLL